MLGAYLFLSSVLLVAASHEKDRVGRTGARVLSDGDHERAGEGRGGREETRAGASLIGS